MRTSRISQGWWPCIVAFLLLLLSVHLPVRVHGFEIGVELAPNIINVDGSMETFVLHTNIPYGTVDPYSVTLNGDENYVYSWKCDSLGYFDAIILISDIEETVVVGEENAFLLKGRTKSGEPFWGIDEIFVTGKAVKANR